MVSIGKRSTLSSHHINPFPNWMLASAVRPSILLPRIPLWLQNFSSHYAVFCKGFLVCSATRAGSSAFTKWPHNQCPAGRAAYRDLTWGGIQWTLWLSPGLTCTFHSSVVFVFFSGQYAILRWSFALIFIALGSSLLYKTANVQSHLLTCIWR